MRRFVPLGLLATLAGIAALSLHGCREFHERFRVRQRFEAMRQALRANDTNAAIQLIVPDARAAYQNHLQRFQIFVGTGSSEPWIWLWAGKAQVVPQRRF